MNKLSSFLFALLFCYLMITGCSDQPKLTHLSQEQITRLPVSLAVSEQKGNGRQKLIVVSKPDCIFCKKQHLELEQLDNLTILTFVVPGNNAHSQELAKAAWCSRNNRTWDRIMKDLPVAAMDCDTNHFEKATEHFYALGVQAFPTLINEAGQVHTGWLEADEVKKFMKNASS